MKKDDCTLSPLGLQNVRKYADLLLKKADAYGVFPTPVNAIIEASKLEISRENALDRVFLGNLYRNLPNSLKLLPDVIRRAANKVLGILDRTDRVIHLDPDLHEKRRLFISLHETGHDALPWQRKTYAILEDSEEELDPDIQDLYEREANCFASEVMFQLDRFAEEAADFELGVRVPIDLAKRYGSSVYAAARRYVSESKKPCVLLVFDQPTVATNGAQRLPLRRVFQSSPFNFLFGRPAWPTECGPDDFFVRMLPRNRFTAPRQCMLHDRNGDSVECVIEAFDSRRQVFFLIYPTDISASVSCEALRAKVRH